VLLVGYMAVNDFNDNYFKVYQYLKELKIMKMLEYTRFIRRLNNLEEVIEFYGFKVHMVVNTNKEPIYFYISEGSMHDIKASYKFLPSLPKNSIVIGDKGYVSNELKNLGINISPIFNF